MDREKFEKRLYISYLDETTVYSLKDVIYLAVVSMTASKEKYIQSIERNWAQIRRRFGIKDGVCLHFTDIKALLNPKYYERPDKERNLDMEEIFCYNGKLQTDKLYNFYIDICNFIKDNDFTIQVSGERYLKSPMFANKKIKEFTNGYWYPLFRDHLDSMAYYFIKTAYDDYIEESKSNNNAKYSNKMVKLRYDGDFELSVRNDFRNAFSHSISNGTKRFTSDAFKDIFDEVRFIDKSEIGYCVVCTNECNSKLINHAGNEIVDFITLYAANFIARDYMKKDFIEYDGKTEDEADRIIQQKLIININGKEPITPIEYIRPKIFYE
ncbi:MAG: hypothetical protein GXX10_05180 [Clostridiaceae bacterium]|nr:hypothetical protein [Clostridiaceae bacterium]